MAFCCQLLLLLRPAASQYGVLPPLLPLLNRGVSGRAGVEACGGGSGCSSSGGGGSSSGCGAILLLTRHPRLHCPSLFVAS